jgi:chromosome partitioning protein
MMANQKGGVGKTTTSVNIATILAATNHKTLLIDFDPQGNATSGVSGDKNKPGTYEWLIGENTNPIQKTFIPNLDLVAASMDLAGGEIEILNFPNREKILKNLLEKIKNNYEYILIDCPPSLGILTLNAFCASTHIIVPLQCEYYALEGISHIYKTLERVKLSLNPNLEFLGILLTMFDKRSSLNQQIANDIRYHFQDKVFNAVIPRNIKVAEAPSHGKPIILYDVKSTGACAYMDATKEIIFKLNHSTQKAAA